MPTAEALDFYIRETGFRVQGQAVRHFSICSRDREAGGFGASRFFTGLPETLCLWLATSRHQEPDFQP